MTRGYIMLLEMGICQTYFSSSTEWEKKEKLIMKIVDMLENKQTIRYLNQILSKHSDG